MQPLSEVGAWHNQLASLVNLAPLVKMSPTSAAKIGKPASHLGSGSLVLLVPADAVLPICKAARDLGLRGGGGGGGGLQSM